MMAARDDAAIRMEGNPEQGPHGHPIHNSDGTSPTQVLQTMRNLIVEL